MVGLPGVCQLERVVYYQGSCLERSPSVRRCTTQDRCVVIWLPQTGYPMYVLYVSYREIMNR